MTIRTLLITSKWIDYLSYLSVPTLKHYTTEQTTKTQASITNLSKHIHQWLVTQKSTSNLLDILYDELKSVTIREGSDRSYRENLGIRWAACKLESKWGTQCVEGGCMVLGAPAYQNSYRGNLGGQLGVIRFIHRLEDITVSRTLVTNWCDNVSELWRFNIHP